MARYVSIHLMLLFIGRRISDSDRSRKVSIHLMLLFIDNWQIEWILLSYVSIHLMLLFIDFFTMSLFVKSCFNTSHVTLYPVETREYIKRWQFQYISCYSLSWCRPCWNGPDGVSIHLMLLFIVVSFVVLVCEVQFQYISCYSLSRS